MIITISSNDFYELTYDEDNNRVVWIMKGFWKDMSVVPEFENDWLKVRGIAKPGWSILSDASSCKVIPIEVNRAKKRNQEESLRKGCEKIALICDSALTKISLTRSMSESGVGNIIKVFTSTQKDEAEKWLSSK
jgi:hypothetical protein